MDDSISLVFEFVDLNYYLSRDHSSLVAAEHFHLESAPVTFSDDDHSAASAQA